MSKQIRMVKLEEALLEINREHHKKLINLREAYDKAVIEEDQRHAEKVKEIRASLSW